MKKQITKILIANRGEIAVRIIKTARKMNIKTVAVYSEADINSLAVQMADEAYYIGPSPSNFSYLSIKNLLKIIKESGADAVHPGYGFLSENTKFCQELEKIGVSFIGPKSRAINDMGDKIISKKIAKEAGVNIVPGYMGVIKDEKEASEIAKNVGYPVMVKAAAGGGGRGMRIVHNEKNIGSAFSSASKEAINSFGDGRIFIEKFIENPRHIEIQVLADQHGNIVCLGERECSIQRYNQKVIEEAPSPLLDEIIRNKMYEQSKELARKVDYCSAGTVEYIVDQSKNFYFLEMNTRLQVEHPVTELITGLDLVEQMIRVANGEKLSFEQKDVKLKGWAMESRIYAEDPTRNFLPSSGRISKYHEPKAGKNIRIDSGIYEGGEVSVYYDSMVAKLCSYGKNRKEAISYMRKALNEYYIEGILDNIHFLENIFASKKFSTGKLSTNYIAEEYPEGYKLSSLVYNECINVVYASVIIKWLEKNRSLSTTDKMEGETNDIDPRWAVIVGKDSVLIDVTRKTEDSFELVFNGELVIITNVRWNIGQPFFKANIAGEEFSLKLKQLPNSGLYRFNYLGNYLDVLVVSPKTAELMRHMKEKTADKNLKTLIAPISGKIVEVKVKIGEKISAGQELLIVEAMKMENCLVADLDVVIKDIKIKAGDNVTVEQLLVEFE